MKNYIIEFYWGDEFPAVYMFKSPTLEEIFHNPEYVNEFDRYSGDCPVRIYEDVPDAKFIKYLEWAKEVVKYKNAETKMKKSIEKAIRKLEKNGYGKTMLVDVDSRTIYGIRGGWCKQ